MISDKVFQYLQNSFSWSLEANPHRVYLDNPKVYWEDTLGLNPDDIEEDSNIYVLRVYEHTQVGFYEFAETNIIALIYEVEKHIDARLKHDK